jgi:oligopeptide transport system substrate-binding protein
MDHVLRLCFQKDPLTLDPQKSGDIVSSAVIFLLFKGLTHLEPDQKITCDLADSFHIFDNYKKYVFHLNKHYWSNGIPITAHDFVYSWKRALAPDFPVRTTNFFYHIKNAEKAKKGLRSLDAVGIHAENDSTLVVELTHPCTYFSELTAFCSLFAVSSEAQENEIFSISSGPFQLQHWKYGEEILLKRNPYYKNRSNLDAILIRIIPNEKEAFALFENGEIDWIGDPLSPLPINYLPALLLTKKIQPLSGLTSCWFNTLIPPFHNVNLRRAFAYAIPREKLLQKLILPNTALATRFCPSILQEVEASFSIKECDTVAISLFKTALQELRLKRLKITLIHEATDEFSRVAALLKTYLDETFQISIRLEPLSFKEFWHRLSHRQFHVSLFCSISQYTDIVNFLERFEMKNSPKNFSGWESFKYEILLKRYRNTINQAKRQRLAIQAEALLLKEMPIAPLYYYHYAYLQQPHLKNLSISPVGVLQFDRVFLDQKSQVVEKIEMQRDLKLTHF